LIALSSAAPSKKDLATYPTNSFGWMRARLALIAEILAKGKERDYRDAGDGRDAIALKGLWKGSVEIFTATVVDGLISLPTKWNQSSRRDWTAGPLTCARSFSGIRRTVLAILLGSSLPVAGC
jgi:hypothetical protein